MIGPNVRKDQSMVPVEPLIANTMPSSRPTKRVNKAGLFGSNDDDVEDDEVDDEVDDEEEDDKAGDVHETGPGGCACGPR